MVARISFVAALCLLVGVVAGCGGDSRRAESETTESAAQSETETVPAPQPSGTEPVHVSKVLGEFQRAGLIEINRRSLTIINETELRRAADWR